MNDDDLFPDEVVPAAPAKPALKKPLKKYDKLVRDHIPDIIRERGIEPVFRKCEDDVEYFARLIVKLQEECRELTDSFVKPETGEIDENVCMGELADLMEVIDALIAFKKWRRYEIIKLQEDKKSECGGFKERIVLLEA